MPLSSGLSIHDDTKHKGSAKRDAVSGVAGLDANKAINQELHKIAALSADTTLSNAHYTVEVNATAAARTITLPAAATNSGRVYNIKKIDASANAVIIDANAAELIDGVATKSIGVQWDSYTIQCNGTGWVII